MTTERRSPLTAEQWRAHLGVTGWIHEKDGTVCPVYLAPAHWERLWCTEHEQYVLAPDVDADGAR